MAGALTISTLNNDTGVLATQNGMTGIAKAWVNWNGVSGVSIRSSFNVSSVTRNSGGNYTVNFSTAMPNANFASVITCGDTGSTALFAASQCNANSGNTTTTMRFEVKYQSGATTTVADADYCNVAIFSS